MEFGSGLNAQLCSKNRWQVKSRNTMHRGYIN